MFAIRTMTTGSKKTLFTWLFAPVFSSCSARGQAHAKKATTPHIFAHLARLNCIADANSNSTDSLKVFEAACGKRALGSRYLRPASADARPSFSSFSSLADVEAWTDGC